MPDLVQSEDIIEVRPDIYQFPNVSPGSHVYLIRGLDKNVLIDVGTADKYPSLRRRLQKIGLSPRNIDFIILTHEHFDHIGATSFFRKAVIGAHRLAANKIELQDEFVTLHRDTANRFFHAHIWLEDNTLIDLGSYKLRIIHTPGHTSGCICVYELEEQLLFSGDTVFAGGMLSDIGASGNISDYMSSLERLNALRMTELCPAHGRISHNPEQDVREALEKALAMLQDSKALFETVAMRVSIIPRILKKKSS